MEVSGQLCPSHIISWDNTSNTYWIGGQECLSSSPGVLEKRNVIYHCWELNPKLSSPWLSQYTDSAVPPSSTISNLPYKWNNKLQILRAVQVGICSWQRWLLATETVVRCDCIIAGDCLLGFLWYVAELLISDVLKECLELVNLYSVTT